MEIIVGILIIVILLLCCGADWGFIAMVGIMVLGGVLLVAGCFFAFALVMVIKSETVTAVFLDIRKKGNGFPQAWYLVDGEEYPNLFPSEVMLKGLLYKKDKPVRIRLNRKRRVLFDANALSAVVVGVMFCLPFSVFLLIYAVRIIGWF